MIDITKGAAKGRNPFFVVMAAAVAVTVFLGFAPSFYLRSTFNPDKHLSILLHIHGIALSAWIVLFLIQTILIVRGSPTVHRRLGWGMSGLAASIVVLMSAAIVDQMQRVPPPFPAAFALAFGMFDIIVFATLVSWAIYWRKRPDWHKRLMLSATILLLGAPVVRIVAFNGIHDPRYFELAQYCSAIFFFIPCFAFDWTKYRKVHSAYIAGLALILMDLTIQPIVLAWGPWTNFANAIQRFVT
jgi:uncharacterized membrane protein YozB (DUF420 family)